jgi:hypothetical protein
MHVANIQQKTISFSYISHPTWCNGLVNCVTYHLPLHHPLKKGVLYTTHNGPAINLISTIDIYDKLVIARAIFFNIYFNVHHDVVVKEKKS